MLLPRIGALLLAANSAYAFQNSSPFLLLSSDPIPKDAPLQSAQIALSKDVEDRLVEMLSSCDQHIHIFEQEHMSADDLRQGAMPNLQNMVQEAPENKVVQIPEVITMGQLSSESVIRRVDEICKAKGKREGDGNHAGDYQIVRDSRYHLEACSTTDKDSRQKCLANTDSILTLPVHAALGQRRDSKTMSLIYITTPISSSSQDMGDTHLYEMDDPYPSALHTDLKRDLNEIRKRQSDNSTHMQDGLGLFEKYQFFTPALFMGLTVSIFLIGILYVGISAIAGLEVSYMAFNKEMGPQAQKGKQQ